MRNKVLLLNLGSTTIKGAVYQYENDILSFNDYFSHHLLDCINKKEFIESIVKDQKYLLAIAFRVVHGGKNYEKPVYFDEEVLKGIKEAEKLAPLHNSILLSWYQEIKGFISSDVSLIACFDSSFYYFLPEISKVYPIPQKYCKQFGIQKLGFHGFAHQAMLSKINNIKDKKIITMQLGGGCSITASIGGKPIETSMGFTPLEGLMMGTRSGSIDPGIILYLLKSGVSILELEDQLNNQSGLKGLVGTNDFKKIAEMNTEESRFALNLFCRNIAKYIGSYITLLGGVDILVFGGGIGENSSVVRENVMAYLKYAGIFIDEKMNQASYTQVQKISTFDSNAASYIIKPDEELEMVKEVQKLIKEIN